MSSFRGQIFSRFSLIVAAAFLLLMAWLVLDLEPRYRESQEEQLVDTSAVLSSLVSVVSQNDKLDIDVLRRTFGNATTRHLDARIFEVTKAALDMHVYVTDPHGILLYDSRGESPIGTDFSQWRDVALTLKGHYGARTSLVRPGERESMTLYVASPIVIEGHVKGVLSVGKPFRGVSEFIWDARKRVTLICCALLLTVLIATFLLAKRISGPIQSLIGYTEAVRAGKNEPVPRFDTHELTALSSAIEDMRRKLEGKEYVQKRLEAFSHEMKSPVAAIHGAAEILLDNPSEVERRRFIDIIRQQTERIIMLLNRLLELSRLENRGALHLNDDIDVAAAMNDSLQSMNPLFASRAIKVTSDSDSACVAKGDSVLITMALSNLLQNAYDFSPVGGTISISIKRAGNHLVVTIEDNGTGIPEYALEKVFDRFYSLERPDTERKSTGLGLSIVREIATLHGGEVHIANRPSGGCVATLTLTCG